MTRTTFVALLLCAAVTACSRQEAAPSSAAQPAATAPASAGTAPPASQGADEQESAEERAADATAIQALQKWTGDLDGMVERRLIRVLTTYSKTTFFLDKGSQLGIVPDAFRLFEDDLNKKLKTKNIRVHVVFVPVAHDDLVPALLAGRGDIVAAQKIVTEWRAEQVDFTNPTRSGISSVVVTGPGVPPVASPQELAAKEVYLRASDVSEPARAAVQRAAGGSGQAPGEGQAGAGGARRRRPHRDGQRRPRADDDHGRLRRGVLAADLSRYRGQFDRGRAYGSSDGDDGPEEQPAADGRVERIHRPLPGRFARSAMC